MSINTTIRPGSRQGQLTVPWSMIILLAAVMAYADGFWQTTVRGAVGAIERTQQPFASWWRESTLALPVFVFAVLAAMTLALRRFGPELRKPKSVAMTGLLIVAAGTVAGMTQIAVSSAYDYHLQSDQMAMMDSMHGICVGTQSCLAQGQRSTLAAHARALGYVSGLLLVTNLVLVGWVMAIRGGRLKVGIPRSQPEDDAGTHLISRSRAEDLRLLLVVGLLGSAAIHAAVVPEHLTEWTAAGMFFILLTAAELAVAGMLLARHRRTGLLAAVVVSLGPLLLWVCSRAVGLPFGPEAGTPESIGVPDIVACVLEVGTLLAAVAFLRVAGWLRRPAASLHVRALTVVAVIAVTVIGLAGVAPTWFDVLGGADDHSTMVMPR
jgi:hypothetical protein